MAGRERLDIATFCTCSTRSSLCDRRRTDPKILSKHPQIVMIFCLTNKLAFTPVALDLSSSHTKTVGPRRGIHSESSRKTDCSRKLRRTVLQVARHVTTDDIQTAAVKGSSFLGPRIAVHVMDEGIGPLVYRGKRMGWRCTFCSNVTQKLVRGA